MAVRKKSIRSRARTPSNVGGLTGQAAIDARNKAKFRSTFAVYGQITEALFLPMLDGIIREHGTDKWSKNFTTMRQLRLMVYSQLAGIDSLRDLEKCFELFSGEMNHIGFHEGPARSTIAYANQHRDYRVFEALFYALLEYCRSACESSPHGRPSRKFRFKGKLYCIDSTTIDLCHTLYDWADFRRKKGGAKVHMMLEFNTFLPVWAFVTPARKHDCPIVDTIDPVAGLTKGSFVVVDRGYNNYAMLNRWNERGINFVCRAKDNMRYERVGDPRPVPRKPGRPSASETPPGDDEDHVISDEIIRLTSPMGSSLYPEPLRLVKFWVAKTKGGPRKHGLMTFFTNNMTLSPVTIAEIYKARWQIETFFRVIKQNLKIKTFLGTSANAVKIQIYTALITFLLLRYFQAMASLNWNISMGSLVNQVRLSLHLHRNLVAWLSRPRAQPPPKGEEPQMRTPGPGRLF